MESTMSSPLFRLGHAIPASAAMAVSLASRVLASVLLAVIAVDQSYDRTEVFAPIMALLIAATCAPVPGRFRGVLGGLGAGLAFFAGTILTHLGPGVGTLAAGLVALAATFAWTSRRDGHSWLAAVAFLFAAGVMGVLLLGVFFTVEG
ncbi:MAG: hypothetical protein AB7T37_05055 [Dehalococcoidia bacterium]